MKKIRKTAVLASLLTALGLGLAGCEWESPGDNEYWSDSYNWVNFSGVYKNPNGGSVVTDFTSAVTTNTTGGAVVTVKDVTIETGNGSDTSFGGSLLPNVVPGSLQITAGGVTLTDNSLGQLIYVGLGTVNGSISYGSGAWSIDLAGVIPDNGSPIKASYSVFQSSSGGSIGGGSTASKNHGTTGVTILSLTAIQEGNLLTLIDSDGMSYVGKFGSIRSASGDLGAAPRRGDVVIAQFKVEGTSRAGAPVEIVGLLQGTITVTGDSSTFVMSARSMQGQWVEKYAAGKVGDVIGVAKDAAINWVNTGSVNVNL
jgi:hypothetical protein